MTTLLLEPGLDNYFGANTMSAVGRDVAETLSVALAPENTTAALRQHDIDAKFSELKLEALEAGRVLNIGALVEAWYVVNALPTHIPLPEITMESPDIVDLDWTEEPKRSLSLHVGSRGIVGYSALLGSEASYGKVAFLGEIPATIGHLLSRLFEHPTFRRGRTRTRR